MEGSPASVIQPADAVVAAGPAPGAAASDRVVAHGNGIVECVPATDIEVRRCEGAMQRLFTQIHRIMKIDELTTTTDVV